MEDRASASRRREHPCSPSGGRRPLQTLEAAAGCRRTRTGLLEDLALHRHFQASGGELACRLSRLPSPTPSLREPNGWRQPGLEPQGRW